MREENYAAVTEEGRCLDDIDESDHRRRWVLSLSLLENKAGTLSLRRIVKPMEDFVRLSSEMELALSKSEVLS